MRSGSNIFRECARQTAVHRDISSAHKLMGNLRVSLSVPLRQQGVAAERAAVTGLGHLGKYAGTCWRHRNRCTT